MKKYHIEVQLADEKWTKICEIEPDYAMIERRGRLRFWRRIGIIINLRDAEDEAEQQAKDAMRGVAAGHNARVVCITKLTGDKVRTVLYEKKRTWMGKIRALPAELFFS